MILPPPQDLPRKIEIYLRAPGKPYVRSFEECVGSDRAAIYLRKDHQAQLALAKKELGFRMTRCHGIFNEEMGVVRPDGTYNWTKVDAYLDALRKVGMRPFVETGFMPVPLASGKGTIFYYKGNTTPPKSYEAWATLIGAFVRHAQTRYGAAEVRKWPFEIWNEPNLDGFWHGTQADYFHLYEVSARAIKAADPQIRVGGPATAGGAWVTPFLDFCAVGKVPVDFVTVHGYGVGQGFLDENGNQGQVLDPSPDALVGQLRSNASQVRASAFPDLPLIVTEWGPSYSSRDPVHDSYFCAPYILEKLAQMRGSVAFASYWTFSDLFEENGPPPSPFHGGFGLLNAQGLRKPAFFAYRFLHGLRGDELPTADPRALATRDGSTLRIVAWDYTPPKLTESNQLYFKRAVPATELPHLAFSIHGLKPGNHRVRVMAVGEDVNDVYGAYLAIGSPKSKGAELPADALNKLRRALEAGRPIEVRIRVGPDGDLRFDQPLRTNDAMMIEIDR